MNRTAFTYVGLLAVSWLMGGAAQADVLARWNLAGEPGNQATSVAVEFATNVVGALCGDDPDVMASWDFGGTTNELIVAAGYHDPGIPTPDITRTVEWNGEAGYRDTFSMRNNNDLSLEDAIASSNYITWTISPEAGNKISVEQIFLRMSAVNAMPPTWTPRSVALFASVTGFDAGQALSTWTVGGVDIVRTVDLAAVNALKGVTGDIEFRLYAWNAASEFDNTGIGRAWEGTPSGDDLIIYGWVQDESDPLPEPDFCDPALTRTSPIGSSGLTNTFVLRNNQQTNLAEAIQTEGYITWTLRPIDGASLSLTGLFVRVSAQNSTPPDNPERELALFANVTGWGEGDAIATWQVIQRDSQLVDLSAFPEFQNVSESIEFRLFAWNASDQFSPTAVGYDGGAHGGEDDLIIYGDAGGGAPPSPEPPEVESSTDGSGIAWGTTEGNVYTVEFITQLTGVQEWTAVPGAVQLDWTINELLDLPHVDLPVIIYRVKEEPEP